MIDNRVDKFARLLVEYCAQIGENDHVAIEATTAAEPLVRSLFVHTLKRGGFPHLLFDLPDQQELFFEYAKDFHLDYPPLFQKMAYDQFDSRIRVHSLLNPRGLSNINSKKQARRTKALAPLMETQMRRGADGKTFRWVTTLFPTPGYAVDAGLSTQAYEDFVYRACHADEADPIAYWKSVEKQQKKVINWLDSKNQVSLQGPNVDLTLSIKGRKFVNSCGHHNMPDGEVYTGPVEESVNGWVKFTYPAIFNGVAVEGIELTFTNGKVTAAKAAKNQNFLLEMLEMDPGSRYLGEFAIGTNFEIDRFTGNILFDEKIGGTFHLALGAGYPETGSKNRSMIHWDMICDMRTESHINVDGETLYKNGQFVIK